MKRASFFPLLAAVYDRRAWSNRIAVGGRRPPLQKGSRAGVFLLGLLLSVTPLTAHAQTNTDTPAANAPANSGPVTQPALAPAGAPNPQPQQEEDIDDIRPPFFFLQSWLWVWIALAMAVLIVLAVLLWDWLKRRPVFNPKTAYELALEKLEKARDLMNEDDPMPYIVLINETIRTYLDQRFESSSARRTTEEFLRIMEADPNAPLAEYRLLLLDFLKRCDLVKFGRYRPNLQELAMVQQHAINFVMATRPVPASERLQPGDLSPSAT